MSEGNVILTQQKAGAMLTKHKTTVVSVLDTLAAHREVLWAGAVKLPLDTPLRLEQVTLTDKNLVLFQRYRLSKKVNVMPLPLQHTKEVIGNRGLLQNPIYSGESLDTGSLGMKSIDVNFVVPKEKAKPLEFRLRLTGLKDPDTWFRELSRIGGKPPAPPPPI